MRTTDTILGLLRERGRKGLPLERVYRLLYNPDLYLQAYGKIYRNQGAMTPGVDGKTADGTSMEEIETIISALKSGTFRWKPARRTYKPKKNGKKRPLGMPTWTDKVVQEVLRMILEAYYEPRFSDHSHGFRPQRGCHTALREIQGKWPGTVWFIEGDISKCFEKIDHRKIIDILRENIHDEQFLAFIHQLLKAGYLEDWTYHHTYSGTPQGGIVSPILANIYLDKMDTYREQALIPTHNRGDYRKFSLEYPRIQNRMKRSRKKGDMGKARQYKKQLQKLPSLDTSDPPYRRLKFVRYADDFLLGYIGTKEEAKDIKQELEKDLRKELDLELSEEKTLITHARSEYAKFLGYHIHTLKSDGKQTNGRRCINGRIGLRIPTEILAEKCKRYQSKGKTQAKISLRENDEYSIVMQYQSEYRGIVEYYQLAYNIESLKKLKWVAEQSLTKTLARKPQLSVVRVYKKFGAKLQVKGQSYKGIQVVILRAGKKPLTATWGGIPLTTNSKAVLNEQPVKVWQGRTELIKRVMAETCEACESTEHVEVHHIRALKDLKKYTGREKPWWVQNMAARRRKTLVLCRTCHMDLHAGRPMTRHKVKLTKITETLESGMR